MSEQETSQQQPKQTRLSKFASEDERRASLLKSKRDYYRRNNELYKLKTMRNYFEKQLRKYLSIDSEKAKRKVEYYQKRLNDTLKALENAPELVLIQKNRRKQTEDKNLLQQPIETTELKN